MKFKIAVWIILGSILVILIFGFSGELFQGRIFDLDPQVMPKADYDLKKNNRSLKDEFLIDDSSNENLNEDTSFCLKGGGKSAGGDKYSLAMLVGQEIWQKDYDDYVAYDFVNLLPGHIQKRLGIYNDKANCFFSAMDFYSQMPKDKIMKNQELSEIFDAQFCELSEDAEIKFGDLLTVENPNEKGLDNFHHAAVVLNKNFILDKPDAGKSPLRIAPMQVFFDEWGQFWNCPPPDWPQDQGYKCINFRFWREL